MNFFKKEISAIAQLERLEQIQLSKIDKEREQTWEAVQKAAAKLETCENEYTKKNLQASLNWWHTQRIALLEKQNAVREFSKLIKEHL